MLQKPHKRTLHYQYALASASTADFFSSYILYHSWSCDFYPTSSKQMRRTVTVLSYFGGLKNKGVYTFHHNF